MKMKPSPKWGSRFHEWTSCFTFPEGLSSTNGFHHSFPRRVPPNHSKTGLPRRAPKRNCLPSPKGTTKCEASVSHKLIFAFPEGYQNAIGNNRIQKVQIYGYTISSLWAQTGMSVKKIDKIRAVGATTKQQRVFGHGHIKLVKPAINCEENKPNFCK